MIDRNQSILTEDITMNTFIISKRTPPPPPPPRHQGTFNHRFKIIGPLFAVFPAALLLAACPAPGGTPTGGTGGTTPGGGGKNPAPTTYTTTITGTVQDASRTGLGLPGATVSASTSPTATTSTGPDGAFSLQVTHSGSFTLTAAKTCYGTSTTPSITLTGNGPFNAKAIALTPVEPTDSKRFDLTPNADGSTYTLTIADCVRTIAPGEFASESRQVTDPADSTRQITAATKLAGLLGSTNQDRKVTAIELPNSLVNIREDGLAGHLAVNGELIIPAAVESIGKEAFDRLSNSSPLGVSLKFAPNSKLKVIGINAFQNSSIVGLSRLPDSLETIENFAFSEAFATNVQSFTIPANVKSVGVGAFMRTSSSSGQFTGTLTIESPHLTRTPPLDPPNTPEAKTGRFGDNLLEIDFGGGTPTNQLTAIYLPRVVFDSYTQVDLNAIFGTFAKPEGKYVDIADTTTELTK